MKKFFLMALLMVSVWTAQAQDLNFVAKKIQFVGLQRITQDTAFSYLPVHAGDKIDAAVSDQIIHDLYQTGFFSDVELLRQGDALIIKVDERPVISKITISGNKVIPSKELNKVLKQMKIAEGYEYNRSILNTIKAAMINQYYSHGKYNARVNINVIPQKNNSVALNITISEGVTATIKQISLIGNKVFTDKELLKQFKLSTPTVFSFITHNDQYASEKLEADLENLRSYYLNRGYLKFQIDSTQVSMTPDRKHVYIAIKMTEGDQYRFAGYDLQGNLILPKQDLQKLVGVKKGAVFSRQVVINSEKSIGDALGSVGYYHAQVQTNSKVDEQNKTIFLTFNVVPGPRIYVRHIIFSGNTNTNDFAFRRTLQQMEGGLISTKAIDQSKQRLLGLPFVSDVDVTTQPVAGKPNQVDMNYKVTTQPAGEVKAGVGYSDVDGILLNAGVNQQNIFGTGNSFSTNISYSKAMLSAGVNYYNPYYTNWGVGRGFSLYGSRYNAKEVNITDYATDNYGGAVNYSIPVAQYDSLLLGFGIDYLDLHASSNPTDLVQDFIHDHGHVFWQIPLNLGLVHNTLNRAIFPTKGVYQEINFTLSAPVERDSLEYYKATYDITYYHPVYEDFVGKLSGDAGYGGGYGNYNRLPFFKNFYVGGMGSVRGYEQNSIGPQDLYGNAIGGNLMFDTSAALIFPNPFSKALRTSWFFDAGNVYDTQGSEKGTTNHSGRIRMSSGFEFDWLSPLGMLNFSLAKAINPTKDDDTQLFQFNIGTSF